MYLASRDILGLWAITVSLQLKSACLNLQSKEHLAQASQVSGNWVWINEYHVSTTTIMLTSALHAGNHQIEGAVSRRHATSGSTLNADAHLSRETKHHTCACETLHVLSSSSSSQLTADCPVSVAIPTAREDSLSMADVNYRMLVGPAGPGSTMPAELSVTSSDPEGPPPHTQHQVYSTPSQESSCGGHKHSCLVVGKLFWWVFKNNFLYVCIHNWLHFPDHEVSGSVLVYSLFVFSSILLPTCTSQLITFVQ